MDTINQNQTKENGNFTIFTHYAGLADVLRGWQHHYYPAIHDIGKEHYLFSPLSIIRVPDAEWNDISETTGIQADFTPWKRQNFTEIKEFHQGNYKQFSQIKEEVLKWIHANPQRGAIVFLSNYQPIEWNIINPTKPNFRKDFIEFSSLKTLKYFEKKPEEYYVVCHIRRSDIAVLQNPDTGKWIHAGALWHNRTQPCPEFDSFEAIINSISNTWYRPYPPVKYTKKLQEIHTQCKQRNQIMKTFIVSDGYEHALNGLRWKGIPEEKCQEWIQLAMKEYQHVRIGDEITEIIGNRTIDFIKALDVIYSADIILWTSGVMIGTLLGWFHRTQSCSSMRIEQ